MAASLIPVENQFQKGECLSSKCKVKVKSAYEPGGPSGQCLTLASVARTNLEYYDTMTDI